MANQNTSRIGNRPAQTPVTKLDTLRDAWGVMKPFAKFSIKALQVIGHALIFIVKNVPKPEHHERPEKGKIIKI